MRIETDIDLLIYRRTKIVATLGPSSSDTGTIERLINTGVNVFRLNMSHGTHDSHRKTYHRVRETASRLDKPIAVMADLCGPKIRVGAFPEGRIELIKDDSVKITAKRNNGS